MASNLQVKGTKRTSKCIEADSETRVRYGNIVLLKKDRQHIVLGKQLNDQHVNAYQQLLKEKMGNINGLQDTLYQRKKSLQAMSTGLTLQIIHVQGSHWAALRISGNDVFVYDSSYTTVRIHS